MIKNLSRLVRQLLAVGMFAACVLQPLPAAAAEADVFVVTRAQLRELGIAIDTRGTDRSLLLPVPPAVAEPLPHKCYGTVSVSDELLQRMQSLGFSLQTLCIGLMSAHVAFHPETGRPLPIAEVHTLRPEMPGDPRGKMQFLLEIPRCFARGTPYLDCKTRFEHTQGGKLAADAMGSPGDGEALHELMQLLQTKGVFKRECGCGDLELAPDEGTIQRRKSAICRVDRVPECPKVRSALNPPGSLLMDLNRIEFEDMAPALARLGIRDKALQLLNESVELSPDLPNGYAHTWLTPEGDSKEAVKAADKGRKLAVGSSR